MRRLATLTALLLTVACSALTENELQVDPSDVSVEVVSGPVPGGSAAQIRITNHAYYKMVAGGLNLRIDIWPDDHLWAIWDGQLYKQGGVTLAPGETRVETIDVVETLPPGLYNLGVGVMGGSGDPLIAVATIDVTLAAPAGGPPELVLEVTVASAAAGTQVPVRFFNGTEDMVRFAPLGCGWYDVQQLVADQWITVPSFHSDACMATVDGVRAGEISERSLAVPTTATRGTYRFAIPTIVETVESVVFSNGFEVP